MSNYTLDISKWRCGAGGKEFVKALNSGQKTSMINGQGNMCCLGQFAAQKGVDLSPCINNHSTPSSIANMLSKNYDESFIINVNTPSGQEYANTELVNSLIKVNDDDCTTIEDKISSIGYILAGSNHTLEVIGWDWLAEQRNKTNISMILAYDVANVP